MVTDGEILGWSCPSTRFSVVAPSFLPRPLPTYTSLGRVLQGLGVAKLNGFGSSGAFFGTRCAFVFSRIPLIFGGETIPVGAPLDVASRSSLLLRSAQTLSAMLLGFEFLQRPQHVLNNLPDGPHASVWAGSSTIAFSSAFPLALPWHFPPFPPFAF